MDCPRKTLRVCLARHPWPVACGAVFSQNVSDGNFLGVGLNSLPNDPTFCSLNGKGFVYLNFYQKNK